MGLKCGICNSREAFYFREYEGVPFCPACFKDNFENRVRRTISQHKMLSVKDHLALAVSGGKDSLTLLRVLNKFEKKFPESRITAVTVDEGIEGYRTEAICITRDLCAKFGVDHRIVSFKELYGYALDELVAERRLSFPCRYCGVLRRKAINLIARKVNATKIATGHNMDDEVQTFVLNMFHGDVPRISRSEPYLEDSSGMFLPRVKPLAESPEREIVLYAYVTGINLQTIPCPYASTALRNDIRTMLNRFEMKHVGMKFAIYRSVEHLRELIKNYGSDLPLRRCDSCGEPTTSKMCEACRLLNGTDEQ